MSRRTILREAFPEPDLGDNNPFRLSPQDFCRIVATSIATIRREEPVAPAEINLSFPCIGVPDPLRGR